MFSLGPVCFLWVSFVACYLLVVLMAVSTSASDRLERLISEMTCNMFTLTLNLTQSLIQSCRMGNMRC